MPKSMIINKIPRFIRVLMPKKLKRAGLHLYLKLIMRDCPGKKDTPRISFAGILPKEGSFIRGGKVKLTHLRKRFGEYQRNFNILYLVSSTLPGFPDIWVSEAKKAGVKIVWNQNGIGYPAWAPKTWQSINETMKPLAQADFVAYQSRFAKKCADEWVIQTKSPYDIVTNCVDTKLFRPPENNLPQKPIKLLIMGTHMTKEKVFIPLETLRILLNRGLEATLAIIGPSEWKDAENDITKKISELRLENKVLRRGKFLQHEAPELYRTSHIFIHLKHMDSSPTAILEAMSSGLPVIGSKSGGVAEWIAPTAGILLDVPLSWEKLYYPKPEAVADAVELISKDLQKWSIGARKHAVANFDSIQWVDKHEEIFKRVLKTN
ncbi:glycosyltransferase [Candidatus Parcubacteria bacterium]|nr:MAG: glycosyltransferase [Candidatus Parcubacteria bacterium]